MVLSRNWGEMLVFWCREGRTPVFPASAVSTKGNNPVVLEWGLVPRLLLQRGIME